MSETRRQYSDEFRMDSVRLMVMDGLSTKEASQKLGVSIKVLGTWKRKYLNKLKMVSSKESELSAAELAEELSKVRKQLAREKRINEILKKNGGLLCQGRTMKYQFIKDHQDRYEVDEMCEAFALKRSSYYRWKTRSLSARSIRRY